MKLALSRLISELDLKIEIISIDGNRELELAYGARVPVLVLDEEIICEHFLDRAMLNRAIDKARTRHVDEKHS